jgi:hypothetical protein
MGESLAIMGGVKEGEIVARGKAWVAVRPLAGLDPAEQPASIIVRIMNAFIDFHIKRIALYNNSSIYWDIDDDLIVWVSHFSCSPMYPSASRGNGELMSLSFWTLRKYTGN